MCAMAGNGHGQEPEANGVGWLGTLQHAGSMDLKHIVAKPQLPQQP